MSTFVHNLELSLLLSMKGALCVGFVLALQFLTPNTISEVPGMYVLRRETECTAATAVRSIHQVDHDLDHLR